MFENLMSKKLTSSRGGIITGIRDVHVFCTENGQGLCIEMKCWDMLILSKGIY